MPKPDVIEDVAHLPEECVGCPHFRTCPRVATSSVRNEIDVEIKTVLRRHYTESYACAKEGERLYPEVFRVPFTNHRAEQSLCMAKMKSKVSGCMRTDTGADDFAAIMSFIGSVKRHGINVFSAVKKAFLGQRLWRPFPCLD